MFLISALIGTITSGDSSNASSSFFLLGALYSLIFSIPSDSLVSKSSSLNSWIISSEISSMSSLISSSRLNTITSSSSSSSSKLYTGAPLISSSISSSIFSSTFSSKISLLSSLMFSLISTSRFSSVVYSISSSLIILSFSSKVLVFSLIWSGILISSNSIESSLRVSFSIDFCSFLIGFLSCDSSDCLLICSFWAFWGSSTVLESLFCLLFTNSSPIFLNLFIRDFATVLPLFLFLFEVLLALLEPAEFSFTLNSPSWIPFLFEELSLDLVLLSLDFPSNLEETSSLDELNLGLLWGFELGFFSFSWSMRVLDLILLFLSFLIFSLGISVFSSFSLLLFLWISLSTSLWISLSIFLFISLLIFLFLGTLGFLSSILIFSIDGISISSSSSIRSGISLMEVLSSLEEFLVNSSSNPSKYLLIKSSFSLSFSAFSLISSLIDWIFAKSLSEILFTISISSSSLFSMKSSFSSSLSSFPRITVVTGLIFIDSTSLIFFFKSLTLVLTIVDSIFSNSLALAKSLFLYQSVDQIW